MTFASTPIMSLGFRPSLLTGHTPGCPQQPVEPPVSYDIHLAICSLQIPNLRGSLERGVRDHGVFTTEGKIPDLACALSWSSCRLTWVQVEGEGDIRHL